MYDLDPWDHNNGFINEDLIVWMREAAFPNFKKLYGEPELENPSLKGCRLGTTASISPTVVIIIHLLINAVFYQIDHFEI